MKTEKPKIGYWYTRCCYLDLKQIEDEEELQDCIEELNDEDGIGIEIWKTKKEALIDLLPRHEKVEPEIAIQIKEELLKL